MAYNKPEVLVLGDAARVIQSSSSKQVFQVSDAPQAGLRSAAYDLDD